MKTALVTGSTSGIGLSICKKLLNLGFRVIGLGRDFSKIDIENTYFIGITCDLSKYQNIEVAIKEIKKNYSIDILINSAGVGFFAPHEELNPNKLHSLISLNLEAPLILCNLLLREIKKNKGIIINISSITAKKSSVFGCAYSATKAGLSHFSKSLFDEVRKSGVKVVCLHPDITKTPFYNNLNFKEGENEDSFILPECIAESIEFILSTRAGTVISEMTIQPQKHQIQKRKPLNLKNKE